MGKAIKTDAAWLGVVAGIAGLEHGYFEFIQGNTPPPGLAFPHGDRPVRLRKSGAPANRP